MRKNGGKIQQGLQLMEKWRPHTIMMVLKNNLGFYRSALLSPLTSSQELLHFCLWLSDRRAVTQIECSSSLPFSRGKWIVVDAAQLTGVVSSVEWGKSWDRTNITCCCIRRVPVRPIFGEDVGIPMFFNTNLHVKSGAAVST